MYKSLQNEEILIDVNIKEADKGGFMPEKNERNTHLVYEKESIGEVRIAEEVVAVIAGLAATEVEGVNSMAGDITSEIISRLGMKDLSKGVKVEVNQNHVSVDLKLNIKYTYNIPEVSGKVQERVKSAIENMTGLSVIEVNIKVAGVDIG